MSLRLDSLVLDNLLENPARYTYICMYMCTYVCVYVSTYRYLNI